MIRRWRERRAEEREFRRLCREHLNAGYSLKPSQERYYRRVAKQNVAAAGGRS